MPAPPFPEVECRLRDSTLIILGFTLQVFGKVLSLSLGPKGCLNGKTLESIDGLLFISDLNDLPWIWLKPVAPRHLSSGAVA